MLRFLFLLHYRSFSRKLRELGIIPFWGILILLLSYAVFLYWCYHIQYGEYVVWLTTLYYSLSFYTPLQEFITQQLSKKQYYQTYIFLKNIYILPAILFLLVNIQVFFPIPTKGKWYIPSPFLKYSIDAHSSWRNPMTLFLLALLSYAFVNALWVRNMNLSLVCITLIFIFFINLSTHIESSFFIWQYADNPVIFLRRKMKEMFFNQLRFIFLISILFVCFFYQHMYILLLIIALGFLVTVFFMLAKYSYYPTSFSMIIPMIYLSILFYIGNYAVLILLIIPILYFYKKSLKNLSEYLC